MSLVKVLSQFSDMKLNTLIHATCFVCRSANQMPKAVQKSLKTVFRECGGMSEEDADAYFSAMEAEGRYQEETWS